MKTSEFTIFLTGEKVKVKASDVKEVSKRSNMREGKRFETTRIVTHGDGEGDSECILVVKERIEDVRRSLGILPSPGPGKPVPSGLQNGL